MGISSPSIGYDGYIASDTSLQKDATEYTTPSGTYVTKITGEWIENVTEGSSLRWKCDLKNVGGGSTHCLLKINGVDIQLAFEAAAAYNSHSYDLSITWHRNDVVLIQLLSFGGGTAYVKNVEFAGNKSPIIMG